MGNVAVKTDALRRKFKNLWNENPQNPTQSISNSFILQLASERMTFAIVASATARCGVEEKGGKG